MPLLVAAVLTLTALAGVRPPSPSTCDPRTHAHSEAPLGSIGVYFPALRGPGGSDDSLAARLAREVHVLGGFRVIDDSTAQREAGALGLTGAACGSDIRCLGVLARAVRARYLLVATDLGGGPDRQLLVSLLDAGTLRPVIRVVEDVPADPLATAQAMRRLAVRLLVPDAYVGVLEIEGVGRGARILLDGRSIGTTPVSERLPGLSAGPHRVTVRTASGDIEHLVEVPFHGEVRVRIDAARDHVVVDAPRAVSPDTAGAIDLSSLEPGIEVRVDGDPVAITSSMTPLVLAAAGTRHVGFRRSGQPEHAVELDVLPRHLTPVRLVGRHEAVLVEVSRPRPLREGRSAPPAPESRLSDQILSFTRGQGAPGPRPTMGGPSMAQAVALAAYGYLATELQRLDTRPLLRTNARALVTAQRAQERMVVDGPTLRVPRSPWEWVAIGGGTALIAGGVGLIVRDLVHGVPEDPEQNPAVLLSGIKVTFTGEAGWVRFRTHF